MAYNGWANWHTWNAYNWITSYEGTYKTAVECDSIADLKERFEWLESKDNILLTEIDWEELFKSFQE